MSDRLTTVAPRWSIDIGGAGPLYHRLRQVIEEAILSGKLNEGDPLHPERDLAEHLQVSRVTVRKAIDHLVHDGFLVRRPGSGTFVGALAVRADQPLSRANILIGDVPWCGSYTDVEWIDRSMSHPAPEEMMTLGLSGGSRVARLTRLQRSAGRPIAIECTCISSEFLPDALSIRSSIYKTLTDANFRPIRAMQRISACNIEDPDACMLGVTIGAAGLLTKRVAYLASGRAVAFTRSVFRGDADCFVTELAIPEN
ncbi:MULTISPECIES: GntR family transcriptional regulator [Rhizobium]|uniref:GntR family transcriptional regulator n=1 Tax=Rhizobium TaxID=379 RepID=UPI001C82EAA7|nr:MULTISPECIES: GntR family transcriptional regulator [Rhizobium]MBX4925697.1 GntR family transcriptional regulator [Rhizobium binae]MBX5177423.1 GntR family transcriptional regulator [Rhizobium lentis]